MKVLLVTPPFVQLNTPYPATTYLKGFLNTRGIHSYQIDLGIEVILKIFSKQGLTKLFGKIDRNNGLSQNAQRILTLEADYLKTIDPVIRFLQGKNPDLAYLINKGKYLPQASRFNNLDDLEWAFGNLGIHDKAKHLCTLYLEDISDLIIETVDPNFGFSRYAERLARSAASFDRLEVALRDEPSFTDGFLLDLLQQKLSMLEPDLVALTVPFPGNLYGALKIGQWIKHNTQNIKVCLGGGYANTELRELSDTRVFNYVDYITLDDGETPLWNILEHLQGKREVRSLKRTFVLSEKVEYMNSSEEGDVPQSQLGTPDYSDLPLDKYLSVLEVANPMHRLWSDGRWNKLTLAHGCYWGKCTFCDISLDYIERYEPVTASKICDRIEELIEKTGQNGFHFVDEAAPPSLLKAVALEILKRQLSVVWWTNIRFEKNFTRDLCRLLAASGCIAVSGGLEVASDRLLALIKKGVTVEQVTKVADHFTESGVMVHAYLMYGFPTQTEQETIDSLEIVRQLFLNHVIQSGFWHLFAMTTHSPVGANPAEFKVEIKTTVKGDFANNDLEHSDPYGAKHEDFSEGLRKSLFNYMHGLCFDWHLSEWFDFEVPETSVAEDHIETILQQPEQLFPPEKSRIVWLGAGYNIDKQSKKTVLTFSSTEDEFKIKLDNDTAEWFQSIWPKVQPESGQPILFKEFKESYSTSLDKDFESFWVSREMQKIKDNGLLAI